MVATNVQHKACGLLKVKVKGNTPGVGEKKYKAHLLEVNHGAAEVLREASSVSLHQAEVVAGLRQPLRGRERVPPGRLPQVLANSRAVLVCDAFLGQENEKPNPRSIQKTTLAR